MGLKPRRRKSVISVHGDGVISNLGPIVEGAKDALLRGELDQAESDLRKALELLGPLAGSVSPLTAMAHGYLGHVYAQRGDAAETLTHYRRAVTASPAHDKTNVAVYLDGQAGALAEMGQLIEAGKCAEKALATAESAYGNEAIELIHFTASLGFLLAESGEHSKVISVLTRTIELCDKHSSVDNLDSFLLELALAHRECGQLRDSIKYYERALKVASDKKTETVIHKKLAELYEQVGSNVTPIVSI